MSQITNNVPQDIVQRAPNELLKRYSGEFSERALEIAFLKAQWKDYKKSPQNTIFIGGLFFIVFIIVDLLTQKEKTQLIPLVILRGIVGTLCLVSSVHIHRAKTYFDGFHLLSLLNQLVMASAMILVGILAKLSFIHNSFHLVMAGLVFFPFIHNRFRYSLIACAFYLFGYLAVSFGLYQISLADLVRFVLYFILASAFGISLMGSLNRSWRNEYMQNIKEHSLNQELRKSIDQLRHAQQEVRVLQGLIPICSHCKKIRDDQGVWNQLESYIQDHSEASFSHGICPTCVEILYPDIKNFDERT